jgi:hypothetical protein
MTFCFLVKKKRKKNKHKASYFKILKKVIFFQVSKPKKNEDLVQFLHLWYKFKVSQGLVTKCQGNFKSKE